MLIAYAAFTEGVDYPTSRVSVTNSFPKAERLYRGGDLFGCGSWVERSLNLLETVQNDGIAFGMGNSHGETVGYSSRWI